MDRESRTESEGSCNLDALSQGTTTMMSGQYLSQLAGNKGTEEELESTMNYPNKIFSLIASFLHGCLFLKIVSER